MGALNNLIVYKTQEVQGYLDHLAEDIKREKGRNADLLLDYPVIYIHVWRSKADISNNQWSIYVGETNDIISRTKEHWAAARIPKNKRRNGNWQHHLLEDIDDKGNPVIPTIYLFGHKDFNKSLTLDIENKLIDFCLAMETTHTYNGRGNEQGNYAGDENLDKIFSSIWKELKKDNNKLFLSESAIQKSAIYKASPNHRLTDDQKQARQLIIDRTVDAILSNKKEQLIFVEGEAGTGKTVLTSSTFYDILDNDLFKDLKCYMLINQEEQRNVYKNMAKKLGYSDDIIQVPTTFLKNHSVQDSSGKYLPNEDELVDLVFVDEAHLLWNQTNQAYNSNFSKPQLDEIMKRSRVTVIMFDEYQILDKRQLYVNEYMEKKREKAQSQGPNVANGDNNYIKMTNQLRMDCDLKTLEWIDNLSKEKKLGELNLKNHRDSRNYEIRTFDSPELLHEAIIKKALNKRTPLSRVIATYDWKFIKDKPAPQDQKYWKVQIGDWSMPWNEQIYHVDMKNKLKKRQKRKYDALDWAEKDYTINEAGSTFTIQGFDLNYAGVILGPSIRYKKETKEIWFDESKRYWDKMNGKRTLRDNTKINVTDIISRNELRVLMTRGTDGLYIYACDKELREALKKAIH